jgi:hypothetical protein
LYKEPGQIQIQLLILIQKHLANANVNSGKILPWFFGQYVIKMAYHFAAQGAKASTLAIIDSFATPLSVYKRHSWHWQAVALAPWALHLKQSLILLHCTKSPVK